MSGKAPLATSRFVGMELLDSSIAVANIPSCRGTEYDRVWTCTGEFQRAIHTVSEDGKPMKVHWD